MADNNTQVAVIGAGPGGYAAAFLAADMGMAVTLIDPAENPGGVCLYRGCIPSKALLHVARLIHEAADANAWGVSFGKPKIDINRMRAWKSDIINGLTGGLGRLVTQRKITHVRATAQFKDDHTLSLTDSEGKIGTLGFDHAILATGSRAVDIPMFPADSDRIWNSKKALDLESGPQNAAGGRRRLYRPGTGQRLCGAGVGRDRGGNVAPPLGRRGSGFGSVSRQDPEGPI
jgi:dihydrolipoamide dehydrogenase